MKLYVWIIAVAVGALPGGEALAQSVKPQEGHPQDAVGWLNWMAKSAAETVFSGTYIYQYGARTETSRVIHIVDEVGEHEKLETLDGPPREIIRKNDEIVCYIPEAKLMKLDRKRARKFFPGLLSNVSSITENYSAKLGGVDRVAGFDCQIVILDPKDNFRFGHRFCAELTSGLLLRATMVSDKADVLEQFTFTQVAIGAPINRDLLKSTYVDKRKGWQTDKSALNRSYETDSGWHAKSLPAGFKKIVEVKRTMSGHADPVIHQIYSDGLASVSVFIETTQPGDKPQSGLLQQGAYNLYVRPMEDQPFSIKVLGEVPRISLQQIGNSLVSPQRQ
jgi:sigma-E factor negative regulatory protein RseB